jgi:hypothetical protein
MKTLNRNGIAKRYGVDYSTVFGWTKDTSFPASIGKRKHGALFWNANEVYAWVSTNRPHNKMVKVIKVATPVEPIQPVIQPSTTTLEVINLLLKDDKAKQRLVLDLLLD